MALQSNLKGGGSISNYAAEARNLQDASTRLNSVQNPLHGQILTDQQYAASNQLQSDQIEASRNSQQAQINLQRLQDDPWSAYRGGAADSLAVSAQNDPTEIYRNKLEAMAAGKFGIDDPSYKFRFEQGQQALERSQASRGFLGSGNAALELQQYGQESASQEYGAQFQRLMQGMGAVESQYNSSQSRLMQLAGIQTPGVQSGINAGLTQSLISANTASNNTAENARQFNVGDMRAQQFDSGVGVGLGAGGNSWQDQISRQMEAGNASIRAGNNI